jgi:hypothetical protein
LAQRAPRVGSVWREPLLLVAAAVVAWLAADAVSSLSVVCRDVAHIGEHLDQCTPALPGPLSVGAWIWLGANRDFVIALAAIVAALFAVATYGAMRSFGRFAAAQLVALEDAVRAAQASADAAATSATNVALLERAWLFVDNYRLASEDRYRTPNSWTIVLRWRNVGRAPAIVDEFVLKIEDADALPHAPDYAEASLVVCNAHAVEPGHTFVTQRVGPSAAIALKDGRPVEFVVFGKLVYRQLGGGRHATGFALRVSPLAPTASLYRSDAYNYWN